MSTNRPRPSRGARVLAGPSGERLVAVGRFGRPHGVGGEIRLETMGGLPQGLEGYGRFFLDDGKSVRPVAIEGWRSHGERLLVAVEGVEDRDEVAALTGQVLCVPRADLPPLGEGEYYHADLLGCAVEDEAGQNLGTVSDVRPWGDYDMLTVALGTKTWMLPVIGAYVLDMDLGAGRIVVSLPEGLGP